MIGRRRRRSKEGVKAGVAKARRKHGGVNENISVSNMSWRAVMAAAACGENIVSTTSKRRSERNINGVALWRINEKRRSEIISQWRKSAAAWRPCEGGSISGSIGSVMYSQRNRRRHQSAKIASKKKYDSATDGRRSVSISIIENGVEKYRRKKNNEAAKK